MIILKRSLLLIAVVFCLATPLYAGHIQVGAMAGAYDFVPQPRLISPIKEVVDLTGKDELEFIWSPHEGRPVSRRYYDFRLYKGREMLESTLIFKERVGPHIYKLSLRSDLFEDSEVYTWSLRQVYYTSGKSLRSSCSFMVVKKSE